MNEQDLSEVAAFVRETLEVAKLERAFPNDPGKWAPAISALSDRILRLKPRWCGFVDTRALTCPHERLAGVTGDSRVETLATFIDAPSAFPELESGPLRDVAQAYLNLQMVLFRIATRQRRDGDDGNALTYYCGLVARTLKIQTQIGDEAAVSNSGNAMNGAAGSVEQCSKNANTPGPFGVEAWRDTYRRIAESVNAMDLAILAMPHNGCNVPRGAKCLGCGIESDWTPIGEAYDNFVSGMNDLVVVARHIAPTLPASGSDRATLAEVVANALEACAMDCLGRSPLTGDSIDADAGRALGDRVDAITADLRAALGVPGWRGLLANTPAASSPGDGPATESTVLSTAGDRDVVADPELFRRRMAGIARRFRLWLKAQPDSRQAAAVDRVMEWAGDATRLHPQNVDADGLGAIHPDDAEALAVVRLAGLCEALHPEQLLQAGSAVEAHASDLATPDSKLAALRSWVRPIVKDGWVSPDGGPVRYDLDPKKLPAALAKACIVLLERREAQSAPAGVVGDAVNVDSEYRPATWFRKGMADRLRQAASKKRKGKRVATRTIDGVVCYSVADARRWWPDDVPKEA